MDKLCRSCKEPISIHARVCTYCGSPQAMLGRFAAALKWIGGIATVVSLVLAVNSQIDLSQAQLEKREALHELADAAGQLRDDVNYARARAWALYSDAEKLAPGSRHVRRGQEVLAEEWLPNVQITGKETFTDIVNKTLPVLMRALVRSDGPGLYRRALQLDPDNVYVNTFLGHWYFSTGDEPAKGWAHFERALNSGKHRLFVRDYQWSALSNFKRMTNSGDDDHIALRAEQLKMIYQLAANNEPWVTGRSDRMPRETIEAYGQPHCPGYDWFDKVWPALEPQQHLQLVTTMAAEFSENSYLWPLTQFLLGRIQEQLNNRDQALFQYRLLDSRLPTNEKLREPLDAALQRLTGEAPAYALLRSDPLAFHSATLANKAFDDPDYVLAMNYFDELVGNVYYQQEVDKVETAIVALKICSKRVAQWLEQHNSSQNGKDELLDAY